MGFVSGLLGLGGGASGSGFASPKSATVLNPATEQMGTDALKQQQALINAYQPGGTAALGSQQQLLQQLQNQSMGIGPNPAQNQLNQATAANTANQAALMASQRGTSRNPGLIARQAAMQGAQNQQNAAGQAATLNAQQQLAARQQLAAQQAQMVGQQQAGTQQYTQNLLNQINAQNQANVGMQGNVNTANAGLAGKQMEGQQNMLGNLMNGAGTAMNLFGGAGAAGEVAAMGGGFTPELGAMGGGAALTGGELLPAIGGAAEEAAPLVLAAAEGGQVPQLPMAQGGQPKGPRSKIGQHMQGSGIPIPQSMPSTQGTAQGMFAQGGQVPALVSPGEQYLPPETAKKVAKEGKDPLKHGERIPGKPKYKGNDYRNDTVRKNLEEGGVIIPNDIMQGPNAHWAALKFVRAHIKKSK